MSLSMPHFADVWHEGSKSFYRAVLLEPLSPEAVFADPTEAPSEKPVYGFCPKCNAPGMIRERRPNGNDTCVNGHVYPSATAKVSL